VRKAWIVARHEFLVTVKRVWFVIATFVLPLITTGIGLGMWWVGHRTVEASIQTTRQKPLGVIDEWGGLKNDPPFEVRTFTGTKPAIEALQRKEIGAYVIVPPNYLETGTVRAVFMRLPSIFTAQRPLLPEGFDKWLVGNVLSDVDERRVARAKAPLNVDTTYLDVEGLPSAETDKTVVKRFGTAMAFFVLLFMTIFTSSHYLLQGIAEEKENRVMEIVLASVTPGQLMLGKLLGLGAAGLLQMAVWVMLGIATVLALTVQLFLTPATFLLCLAYFLLGYVLYGSLMLGFGALGTNLRESQQLASVWTFVAMSPWFIQLALTEAPQGTLARVFSFVPFTAPQTMMFRYAIDPKGTPWLDIVISIVVLGVSTVVALKLSARLFRAGLLLYGKRPGVREIWRWLLAARS